jgi:transcriptional regulator with AAA-type ATPase domain
MSARHALPASLPHPPADLLRRFLAEEGTAHPWSAAVTAMLAFEERNPSRDGGLTGQLALAADGDLPPRWRLTLLRALGDCLPDAGRLEALLPAVTAAMDGRLGLAFRLIAPRIAARACLLRGDHVGMERALAGARTDPGSDGWIEFTHRLALSHWQRHAFAPALDLLDELQPHASRVEACGLSPLALVRICVQCEAGDPGAARLHLDPGARWAGEAETRLALAEGRLDQAGAALAAQRRLEPRTAAHLAAMLALLRRDGPARQAAMAELSPQPSRGIALLHALNHGAVEPAAALLAAIDPDGAMGAWHVEWARLHRWRGDHAAAGRHLAQAAAKGFPGYIRHRLRLAAELDAATVADLWTAAEVARRGPRPATTKNVPSPAPTPGLVGSSRAMAVLRRHLATVAERTEPVLLIGETGTGKEEAARVIHRLAHADAPFIAVNCAGLPASLVEAELFGHERGAFTGADRPRPGCIARAAGGTLFLDEIASLALPAQGALLRVLEGGDYQPVGGTKPERLRARIIAATDPSLVGQVEAGSFRADLYYRLHRLAVHLPPLRERREDIPELAAHFAARLGLPAPAPDAWPEAWAGARWPGNVRELRNEVERRLILGGELGPTVVAPVVPVAEVDPRIPGMPTAATRRQRLLDLARRRGRIAPKQAAVALACNVNTAREDLRVLAAAGLLACRGSGRGQHWIPETYPEIQRMSRG